MECPPSKCPKKVLHIKSLNIGINKLDEKALLELSLT